MSKKILILSFLFLLLLPFICFGQNTKKTTPKISFDYIDADVRNVIRSLSEVSGKNVIISEAVKGKVTMKLEDVYWDEALDIVTSTSGLKKIEADNIIRVMTVKEFDDERKSKDTDREIFRKERLDRQRLGEEFVTETIYLNYTTPPDVEKMLRASGTGATGAAGGGRGFMSEFGTITQVPWNNALIIRDTKENIVSIVKIVQEHDRKPQQIQIDCKIVQATSNFSKELGIQWGASYSANSSMLGNKDVELTGGKRWTSATAGGAGQYESTSGAYGFRPGGGIVPYAVNLPAAVGAGSGGVLGMFIGSAADSTLLDIQLSALEAEGKGRVLSNPKVVTSDNRKAIIQQGKSIPYKTVSTTGTQTQFAEAVLGLEVTPTVTNDGYIKLEILAKKDQADFINQSEGVPTIDKKQATTLLYVRDGETAVIGGIYERSENDGESGLPGLRNIPLLGWLFKKTTKSDAKTELLIFITPRILKNMYKDEG
jgi:type IV pilus assembly protein PilQ